MMPSCLITTYASYLFFFFFKQKTAYELGLGIPAEPLFRSCGISTLSQSPMLGFHKQMDNRIKLLEEILSFRMQAVPSFVSGAMAKAGKGLLEGTLQAGTSAVSDKDRKSVV